jgi:hypothetical protein
MNRRRPGRIDLGVDFIHTAPGHGRGPAAEQVQALKRHRWVRDFHR